MYMIHGMPWCRPACWHEWRQKASICSYPQQPVWHHLWEIWAVSSRLASIMAAMTHHQPHIDAVPHSKAGSIYGTRKRAALSVQSLLDGRQMNLLQFHDTTNRQNWCLCQNRPALCNLSNIQSVRMAEACWKLYLCFKHVQIIFNIAKQNPKHVCSVCHSYHRELEKLTSSFYFEWQLH